ncbi:MexX family efflux pump subunit [Betaproteobacteria bacterium]|nr:MexX family efflux pump subunit [Betaproteobacteria bacterium]GHU01256.1 MexX family efflux pump subunit [Betaproteobacteria bacterium]GHU12399.1 MexX family efflux pump subunit [Betaproteobacteria bacterium]GHU17215.1 MexX family efflux pump subunit [Betaproteobacteria bacterium]
MQIRFRQSPAPLVIVLASTLMLAACNSDQAPPQASGPVSVGVVVAKIESAPLVTELPGRTTPYLVAELRPQVTGLIQKRLFTEGSTVNAGQTLYQIDPATYQAAYDSAAANLARAQANLTNTRLKAERYADLVKVEAVSRQANDDADAALKLAEADVAAARAAIEKTRIDLDFTRLRAPISGRIGRSLVTPGALVTANQASALATVQQLDPIYVDLTQSSADMQRLRREIAEGTLSSNTRDHDLPVRLVLEDGSEYGQEGKLAFSEVSVDPNTGSVTLRARFPNPNGELLPGMYVRARLVQGQTEQAILLPHAAVSHDPRGNAQVVLVNAENQAEPRPVQLRGTQGKHWIVTGGIAAGDQVIVEGLQKIRPGVKVQPQILGAQGAGETAAAPVAAQ